VYIPCVMKLDMHIHSNFSKDSRTSPKDILRYARKTGISWVSITDHNTVQGSITALRERMDGVKVLPGIEVSTVEGHILGYGITECIPRGLTLEETIQRVHDLGGVVSIAHPGRFWSGVSVKRASTVKTDLIEVFNSRSSAGKNDIARRVADDRRIPGSAGSDAHGMDEIGAGYLIVEGDAESVDHLLQMIMKGKAKAGGRSRGATGTVKYVTKCVSEWVLRGFKKI